MTHQRIYTSEGNTVYVQYPAEHGEQRFYFRECSTTEQASNEASHWNHYWRRISA